MNAGEVFRRLVRDCAGFRGALVASIAGVGLLGAAQLYLTWLVKEWVEGPLSTGGRSATIQLIAEGVAVMLLGASSLFLSRYLIGVVNHGFVERLRNRAAQRLLCLAPADVRQFAVGDMMARFLSDAATLSGFLGTIIRNVLRESVVASGAVVLLFVLNWRLALVTCTVIPVTVWLFVRLGGVIRRAGARANQETGALGATLNEQLHGFSTVKSFQAEAFEFNRFAAQNASVRRKVMQWELWSAALMTGAFLTAGAAVVAIVWFGTPQLNAGVLSRGELLAFCLYAGQVVEPMRRLSEVQGVLQGMLAAASRVYDVIDVQSSESTAGVRLPARIEGRVAMEDVTFGYRPGDPPVLKGVSFTAGAHEQIALVGSSGSGKTTIANLLVRFYRSDSGCLRLDDADLDDVQLADVRRVVCVVQQEPFLFAGSLLNNLRYGSWQASERDVVDAVRHTGLTALVDALPDGLHTLLQESGHQLSGGEKQRIALARAILRDPRVLVLDEALSAVDSETECAIVEALEPWFEHRTVIAIAHRLSTVRRFPRIVVLDSGRVVGDGPMDALLQECPPFVALFLDQLAVGEAAGGGLGRHRGTTGSAAAADTATG